MSEYADKMRKKFMGSNVIQARKYKREWNSRTWNKVFQRSYLMDSAVKQSKGMFSRMSREWNELMIGIFNLTDKDINVKFSDFPEVGLNFDDVKNLIHDKDNSHYHHLLDDRGCVNGHSLSVVLKRWIWFLNFGDIPELGRKPSMVKEYEEVERKCLAYTNVGIKLNETEDEKKKRGDAPRGYIPCTARCIRGINFCGKHKTWGSKEEHLWKGKHKNDKTVSKIVCGAC